jgi:hypothetical protein
LKRLYDWVAAEHARRALAPWADRLLAEWRLGLTLAESQIEASDIWLEHAFRRRILGQYLAQAGIPWEEIRFWFHFLRLVERSRAHSVALPQTPFGDRLREQVKDEVRTALDERLAAAGRHWHELPHYRRHLQRLWALDIELNRIVDGIADRQSRMRQSLGAEVISEADIQRAEEEAPDLTRARVRGDLIREHPAGKIRASWNLVLTPDGEFSLPTPLSRKLQPVAKQPSAPPAPGAARLTDEAHAMLERWAAHSEVGRRRRTPTAEQLDALAQLAICQDGAEPQAELQTVTTAELEELRTMLRDWAQGRLAEARAAPPPAPQSPTSQSPTS